MPDRVKNQNTWTWSVRFQMDTDDLTLVIDGNVINFNTENIMHPSAL